jgi:probable phosphoglycerate mutase
MTLNAYTDGAVRKGNPGQASCAWLLELPGGSVSWGYFLGPELRTNNYAEYQGVLNLLERLEEKEYRNVTIYCDSKLVVEQVNQRWHVNSEELRPLMSKAYGLLVRGGHVIVHVKGHSGNPGNEAVDLLCNKVLDQQEESDGKME